MRHMFLTSLAIAFAASASVGQIPAAPAGSGVTANMGEVTGGGTLTDRSGAPIGTWSVTARLADGDFTGTGTVTIKGQTVTVALQRGRSYSRNSRCVFNWVDGRTRVEIAGACTTAGLGGTLDAFIPAGDVYGVSGYATGTLRWSTPARAQAAGVVPTVRLTCAYMERIGGNVIGGGPASYALRYSNMGFLELDAGGTYRTTHTSGRWVRAAGNTIRLTSGQFAGAVGRLQPDGSGVPAVYFERDENRTTNGVPIVDIARTSCTQKR